MSEKRFVIDEEGISDNKTDKWYCWREEVVDLLNDQQITIDVLEEKINKLIKLILSNDVGSEMNLDGEFETYYHIPSSELKKVLEK